MNIINLYGGEIAVEVGFKPTLIIEASGLPTPEVGTDGEWIVPMPEQYKNVAGTTVVVFGKAARKATLEGWKNVMIYDPYNKMEDPRRTPSGFERK